MNPHVAHQLLERALEPQNIGRLTRRDYYNITVALEVIKNILPPAPAGETPQIEVLPPPEGEPQTP